MVRGIAHSLAGLVLALSFPAAALAVQVGSPDTRVVVVVDTDDRGVPHYSVRYRGDVIIDESRLGLRFAGHRGFDSGLRILRSERGGSNTVWRQPWGERRRVRDHFNELFVLFQAEEPTRRVGLRVRVYDDGVGFRYEVPEQRGYRDVEIVDELTEFRMPLDSTAWWIPARGWNRYEFLNRKSSLAEMSLAHTPVTLRLSNGTHISIHEAALVDYAGYVLDQRRDGVLKTDLTPWSDGIRVRARTPFVSPWRTIQVSRDAAGLLNSSLILNLNEPNKLGDVSWVQPGKYVGIWWAMHLGTKTWGSGPDHGATTAEARRYIDFAAKHGFDGVLVEGWNTGWDGDWFNNGAIFSFTKPYPDFDLEAVASYARQNGVRLVGHHETSGHVSNYERQMEAAFDLYESLGVRQVKTGDVADGGGLVRIEDGVAKHEWHDGQFAVGHFIRVLEEAARRKISINTHEPVKDTGLRRSYPNWISREGARGQEYNAAWAAPNPPSHNVTLPFTRMLAGPMDFTPGIFDLLHQGPESGFRVQSTLAHQLALYVVLYSPIQMAADLPQNYEARPDAFQFIKDVPTDWEESIATDGEVGEFVVVAREERGGGDWYVGAISGERARDIAVPLSFLEDGKRYLATIYRDGEEADWKSNPYDYVIERRSLTSKDTLQLKLAAGGGAAIRLQHGN
jgi:alpha-glucosidase